MASRTDLGTAMVTGASSGIGATYAAKLAARGYDLVLVARDGVRLRALGDELAARHGIAVDVLTADLTKRDETRRVEARLRSDDRIKLLVNNAGIGPKGPLLADDIDYLEQMIELNVTTANRLAVAAAQTFAARGSGAIINIASGVAIVPELFNGTYSGTKSFVLGLTQSLARELEGRGVRLQAVLPGLTRTELFDRVGGSVENYPREMVMGVDDLVAAALAGFDQGELVTIPSVEDKELWLAFEAARGALGATASRNTPASRYGVKPAAA